MATGATTQENRVVLLGFYKKTRGGSWTRREGWAEDVGDLGSWFGVATNGKGLVTQLELCGDRVTPSDFYPQWTGNNVCGIIPTELGELRTLRTLILGGNKLVGPIPPALAQLASVEHLDLSFNQLEGTIPPELGHLLALQELHLWGNNISGTIPPELGRLVCLTVLTLSKNMLTGSIPPELGRLVALKELYCSGNLLTGPIPPELGQLYNLEELSLTRNNLSGQIPPELGALVALEHFTLGRNKLTGTIPPELGRLHALQQLSLGGNRLSGPIPPELGQLHALKQLTMGTNSLSGAIPPELGQLHALQHLSLAKNNISGTIPAELGQLRALLQLSLWNNNISGHIPPELGRLTALKTMLLSRNELTGAIPPELGQLHRLQELLLGNNHLTGSIPAELHGLVALESLYLSGNQLTGIVPKELGKIKTLARLDLSGNKLTSLGEVEDALDLIQISTMVKAGDTKRLILERNPWIMPPEAVVEEGPMAVEAYLVDVRAAKEAGAAAMVLRLLKVVLVGSSQAGKTSLMNSIVHEEARPTKGTAEEVSTVGIELLRHRLGDVRVELYDCGGQIDYAGMRQIFLSRRALYLLVWDVQKCYGKHGDGLDQVIGEDVMSWLYALHLRAPDSTVILVANKCDGPIGDFTEIVRRVEERIHELLQDWQDNRGLPDQVKRDPTTLNLLAGTSLVSCGDGWGLSQLIDRVAGQGGTSISVPPAWGLALAVLDALRDHKAALSAARQHLKLPPSSQDRVGSTPSFYFSNEALRSLWKGVLRSLVECGELQSTAQKVAISNPDNALEGALWISEFAGQVLRVDDGDGVFLDVVLLSRVLNPIFDHKLRHRRLDTAELIGWRDELLLTGVLRGAFASHLWGDVKRDHAAQSPVDELEKALFDVLVKLGVATPLGRATVPALNSCASPTFREGVGAQDMLVQRWAPLSLADHEQEELDSLLEGRRQRGAREVVLKWMFDRAGPPQGLVGRLIASCHVIGEAEKGLCWRSGAVLKSPIVLEGGGRLYVVEIRYNSEDRVLSIRMSGPLENERVWVALRFMASAMVSVSKRWQGMLWKGWLDCPKHGRDHVYLATPTEARVGSPLVATTSHGCDCLRDEGGVLGLTVARLGNVVDTRAGDPFVSCRDIYHVQGEDGGLQDTDDPLDTESRRDDDGPPIARDITRACCGNNALEAWRPYACRTAGTLLGSAFTLFVAVIGLTELSATMWVCIGFVVLFLLIGAGVAGYVGYAQACEERRRSRGAHEV